MLCNLQDLTTLECVIIANDNQYHNIVSDYHYQLNEGNDEKNNNKHIFSNFCIYI